MSLYTRTGDAGTKPSILIPDLGTVIISGPTWVLLSESNTVSNFGEEGQFTANEIKESVDLYNLIHDGYLDWSTDGVTSLPNEDYTSNVSSVDDFSDAILVIDGYNWAPREIEEMYAKRIDEVSNSILYVGESLPSVLDSDPGWRIRKIIISKVNGFDQIDIKWADGNSLFDKIWDNRASLTYI